LRSRPTSVVESNAPFTDGSIRLFGVASRKFPFHWLAFTPYKKLLAYIPNEVGFLPQLPNTLPKLNHGTDDFVYSLKTIAPPNEYDNTLFCPLASVEYQSLRTAHVALKVRFHSKSPVANADLCSSWSRLLAVLG